MGTWQVLVWVPTMFNLILRSVSMCTHEFSHGSTCEDSWVTQTHAMPYLKCSAGWHGHAEPLLPQHLTLSPPQYGKSSEKLKQEVFHGQSSSKVHQMSVAWGCGHEFVLFTSFTITISVWLLDHFVFSLISWATKIGRRCWSWGNQSLCPVSSLLQPAASGNRR